LKEKKRHKWGGQEMRNLPRNNEKFVQFGLFLRPFKVPSDKVLLIE
jgi:hypothetical protein